MPRGARKVGIGGKSSGRRPAASGAVSLVASGAARTAPRRGYDPAVDNIASPASRTRASDLVLYLVGVAGIAAGITLLFLGMRAVMDVGGMCAEGGPYVIEQHCPEGAALAMLLGFLAASRPWAWPAGRGPGSALHGSTWASSVTFATGRPTTTTCGSGRRPAGSPGHPIRPPVRPSWS